MAESAIAVDGGTGWTDSTVDGGTATLTGYWLVGQYR